MYTFSTNLKILSYINHGDTKYCIKFDWYKWVYTCEIIALIQLTAEDFIISLPFIVFKSQLVSFLVDAVTPEIIQQISVFHWLRQESDLRSNF